MSRLQRIDLTRTARLVLDPREWAGTAVRPGAVPRPLAGGPAVTTVVRVTAPLTVTATPAGPGWPFAGAVELVTQQTPAGLLAWFGRVRVPDGGPLRRLPLAAVTCDLRVTADEYRPADLFGLAVPAAGDLPLVRALFLYPTGELPDAAAGPTVLTGRVTNPDASGLARVRVTVAAPAGPLPPREGETDEDGVWVVECEPPPGPAVDLRFTFPDGTTRDVPGFPVRAGRLNRFPRTTVSGRVRRADGRPAAGAVVTVAPLAGRSAARGDGGFVFAVPVEPRAGGAVLADIAIAAPGRPPWRRSQDVTFGQDNPLGDVVV